MGQRSEQGLSSWDGPSRLCRHCPPSQPVAQPGPAELRAPPTHQVGPKGNGQSGRVGLGREGPPRASGHSQFREAWKPQRTMWMLSYARKGKRTGCSEGCTQRPLNWTDHVTQQLPGARSKVDHFKGDLFLLLANSELGAPARGLFSRVMGAALLSEPSPRAAWAGPGGEGAASSHLVIQEDCGSRDRSGRIGASHGASFLGSFKIPC